MRWTTGAGGSGGFWGRLAACRITRATVATTVALLLLLAIRNSFIQDDAFISFRYAHNLVEHGELTWNPGETPRVEGYTNFLWTLAMAVPIALGRDPARASQVLGLLLACGTLLLTFKLATRVLESRPLALLCVVLLGTNYTFSAYATGGLETQLQTLLVVAGITLALSIADSDGGGLRPLVLLSLVSAAALLTRLDSAIFVAVLYVFLLWRTAAGRDGARPLAKTLAALLLPLLFIVGPWLVWKHIYYGELLPNTFYAKAADPSFEVLVRGVLYLYAFARSYLLIPILLLAIVAAPGLASNTRERLLIVVMTLWCGYLVAVGGDFMEFRFLVPILPLGFILLVRFLSTIGGRLGVALVVLVLGGSVHHELTFSLTRGIESVERMNGHLSGEKKDWIRVGHVLGRLFSGGEDPVVIATTAAGAIPYYSDLPTVDMYGVNDRWIARNGIPVSERPGHRRGAPLEYLLARRVNIVVGPAVVDPADGSAAVDSAARTFARFFVYAARPELLPETSRLVEIPLDADRELTVIYLCRHEAVDHVIRELSLTTRPLGTGREAGARGVCGPGPTPGRPHPG